MIAIVTEDFALYYELVKWLKDAGKSFLSLSPRDKIPASAGVVITTAAEHSSIDFQPTLVVNGHDEWSVRMTLRLAEEALSGKGEYVRITVGIDPGKTIGLAILGDGTVIHTAELNSPQQLREEVFRALQAFPSEEVRFRVGSGDPPNRNRIINLLLELGYPVEITDERHTTRRTANPHMRAAMDIALTSGPRVRRHLETVPTPGEVSEMKRRSRIASDGAVTISDGLSERVVLGEMTLEEAIVHQKRRGKKHN